VPFSPVEIGVLGILHLGISHAGIQKQTEEQFLVVVHGRQQAFEFLFRIGLRRLLGVIEFRQDPTGYENVPCPEKRIQSFEDIVNRTVIEIGIMVT
jgi:hypothetical protein